MTLNESIRRNAKENGEDTVELLSQLNSVATTTIFFTDRLYGDPDKLNIAVLSPFLPLALHQAAKVQVAMWEATGDEVYKQGFQTLKTISDHHSMRWKLAGKNFVVHPARKPPHICVAQSSRDLSTVEWI